MTVASDYATMTDIIDNATDDVNIKLTGDIVVTGNSTQLFNIDGKNILIDLNGHTIQSTSTGKIFNIANGKVSIINSSSTQGKLQANTPFKLSSGAEVDIKGNVLVNNKMPSPAFFVLATATDWSIVYDTTVSFGASSMILNSAVPTHTTENKDGRTSYVYAEN